MVLPAWVPQKNEDGDWRATNRPYLVLNLCLRSVRMDAPDVSGSNQSVSMMGCYIWGTGRVCEVRWWDWFIDRVFFLWADSHTAVTSIHISIINQLKPTAPDDLHLLDWSKAQEAGGLNLKPLQSIIYCVLAVILKLTCQSLVGIIASVYIMVCVLCFIGGNNYAVCHKSVIH